MTVKQMQVVFLSGLAAFVMVSFFAAWIIGLKKELSTTKVQLEEIEDSFQIFRAAAHDAFAWAMGIDEGGERIPAEFFWRYEDNVKTAEESAELYFQAGEIVKERYNRIGYKQRGYSYRVAINNINVGQEKRGKYGDKLY